MKQRIEIETHPGHSRPSLALNLVCFVLPGATPVAEVWAVQRYPLLAHALVTSNALALGLAAQLVLGFAVCFALYLHGRSRRMRSAAHAAVLGIVLTAPLGAGAIYGWKMVQAMGY